jgi:hypothetical protein
VSELRERCSVEDEHRSVEAREEPGDELLRSWLVDEPWPDDDRLDVVCAAGDLGCSSRSESARFQLGECKDARFRDGCRHIKRDTPARRDLQLSSAGAKCGRRREDHGAGHLGRPADDEDAPPVVLVARRVGRG